MDITLLEHFMVIADTQSFTKAADILDKSESVLSRQMARLEEETGITLFNRTGHKISLTPAAITFRAGITDVIHGYYKTIDDALDISRGTSGIIKLGMFENHLLPDAVMKAIFQFQKEYPKIHVQIEPKDILELRPNLMDGAIDIFYSATMAFQNDSELSVLPAGAVKNYLIFSKTHPIASHPIEELELSDFKDYSFIIRDNYPIFTRSFTKTCSKAGFTPKYTSVSNQTQMLTQVLMNEGVLIIDDTHFFVKNSDIVLLPLPELAVLDFGFVYKKDNISGCCQTLIEYLSHNPIT